MKSLIRIFIDEKDGNTIAQVLTEDGFEKRKSDNEIKDNILQGTEKIYCVDIDYRGLKGLFITNIVKPNQEKCFPTLHALGGIDNYGLGFDFTYDSYDLLNQEIAEKLKFTEGRNKINPLVKEKLTPKTLEKILNVFSEKTSKEFNPDDFYMAKELIKNHGYCSFSVGVYKMFIFSGKKGKKLKKEDENFRGGKVFKYWNNTMYDYIVQIKLPETNPNFTETINRHRLFIQNILDGFKLGGINYYPN
ncbi:hypothetical protein J4474_00950 [Candidatus Pacearchaeota archaeon]|nr:hypothetical protein [Candidatus Pacearchaeota archaeon]